MYKMKLGTMALLLTVGVGGCKAVPASDISPKVISVKMNLKKDNGEFTFENLGSEYKPVNATFFDPAYKWDPRILNVLGIRCFYFDKPQKGFLKFISNNRRNTNFLKKMKYDHLDTSSFAHKKLKNDLEVLTGFDSNGNFIAIPDINRNKNFLDDSVYRYKDVTTTSQDSLQKLPLNCPVQEIKIQGWDDGTVQSYTRYIRLVPWIYFSYYKHNPPISAKDSSGIVAQPYQYWEGTVAIDSQKYVIYLHNRRPQLRMVPLRAIELDVKSSKSKDTGSFVSKNLYDKYHFNDTIAIGKERFAPVDFSVTNNVLRLKYVGENTGKEGYMQGAIAKEIKTKDFRGKDFDLKELRGKYVLLDFWYVGCSACEATLPELRKLKKLYDKDRLSLISIALPIGNVANYVSKNRMNWTNLISYYGNRSSITDRYRIGVFPTFILIDPNGKISLREMGIDGLNKIRKYLKDIKK